MTSYNITPTQFQSLIERAHFKPNSPQKIAVVNGKKNNNRNLQTTTKDQSKDRCRVKFMFLQIFSGNFNLEVFAVQL